ncbi:alpha/beta hydrolase [Streptomyces broussonetiae]|nr:alpha/beta hydrolase [Streptomyces broussonetiae]
MGATDRRLRAVVSQMPTISGHEQGLRRVAPEVVAALEETFSEDERARFRGEAPRTQTVVSSDPAVPASYRSQDAIDFCLQPVPDGVWENTVTVRSTRAARRYEPGIWITRVSPTPLLRVAAVNDTVTLTDMALAAYERALEPKRLRVMPSGHFDPYTSEFDQASAAARAWFREHLMRGRPAADRAAGTS